MRIPLSFSIVLTVALLALSAKAEDNIKRIVVIGEGSVTVQPDMGVLDVGVITIARTAAEALKENSVQMAKVLKAATDMGLDKKDLKTSQIMLHPKYGTRSSGSEPKIEGYQASNSTTLKVRDVTLVGVVLDAVSKAGANNIRNIGFSVQSPEPLLKEARIAAVTNAKTKAALYAQAAGVELGDIVLIEEPGAGGGPVHAMEREMVMSEVAPVMPGETKIGANIRIIFEIK